jgi:hypothetical protein
MRRPDHLLDRDVERSTVTVCTSPKGQGLGTKKSGYDLYAIKLLKSNAKLRSSVGTGASSGTGLSGSRRVQTPRQWMCPATILD